jgi:hypothetical protein
MHWLTTFPGYPLGGQFYLHSALHRGLSYVKYAVPLSIVYAIDETKVRLFNGQYYYVWIVRDVKTKGIHFFN